MRSSGPAIGISIAFTHSLRGLQSLQAHWPEWGATTTLWETCKHKDCTEEDGTRPITSSVPSMLCRRSEAQVCWVDDFNRACCRPCQQLWQKRGLLAQADAHGAALIGARALRCRVCLRARPSQQPRPGSARLVTCGPTTMQRTF